MRAGVSSRPGNWAATLHRFAAGPKPEAVTGVCELCAAPLAEDHPHLAEPARQRLLCVCSSCAFLLGNRSDQKYRRVPERVQKLKDFHLDDAEWDATGIPIGLAFFFYSTAKGRIAAFYPGSAGPAESLLDLKAWTTLAARNPVLSEMEPDVEALLVNRTNGRRDHYRVPIDRCYALVGLIRTHWQGVSGGAGAWTAIDGFFASLDASNGKSGGRLHA